MPAATSGQRAIDDIRKTVQADVAGSLSASTLSALRIVAACATPFLTLAFICNLTGTLLPLSIFNNHTVIRRRHNLLYVSGKSLLIFNVFNKNSKTIRYGRINFSNSIIPIATLLDRLCTCFLGHRSANAAAGIVTPFTTASDWDACLTIECRATSASSAKVRSTGCSLMALAMRSALVWSPATF